MYIISSFRTIEFIYLCLINANTSSSNKISNKATPTETPAIIPARHEIWYRRFAIKNFRKHNYLNAHL